MYKTMWQNANISYYDKKVEECEGSPYQLAMEKWKIRNTSGVSKISVTEGEFFFCLIMLNEQIFFIILFTVMF